MPAYARAMVAGNFSTPLMQKYNRQPSMNYEYDYQSDKPFLPPTTEPRQVKTEMMFLFAERGLAQSSNVNFIAAPAERVAVPDAETAAYFSVGDEARYLWVESAVLNVHARHLPLGQELQIRIYPMKHDGTVSPQHSID